MEKSKNYFFLNSPSSTVLLIQHNAFSNYGFEKSMLWDPMSVISILADKLSCCGSLWSGYYEIFFKTCMY